MGRLILDPGSIYRNSECNMVLNKDAIFSFIRCISSINDSIYGIQPDASMLSGGFTLSDVFAKNPLSSNSSLCANVFVLDENVEALKLFAQRPFIVCDSVADRDAKANNPFAVYLTPVVPEKTGETSSDLGIWEGDALTAFEDNDHYEWVYVFPQALSSWEDVKAAYVSCVVDGVRLSAFGGKWELIGSTSLTDEKVADLFRDVNETIRTTAGALDKRIDEVSAEVSAKVSTEDFEAEKAKVLHLSGEGYVESLTANEISARTLAFADGSEMSSANEFVHLSGDETLSGRLSCRQFEANPLFGTYNLSALSSEVGVVYVLRFPTNIISSVLSDVNVEEYQVDVVNAETGNVVSSYAKEIQVYHFGVTQETEETGGAYGQLYFPCLANEQNYDECIQLNVEAHEIPAELLPYIETWKDVLKLQTLNYIPHRYTYLERLSPSFYSMERIGGQDGIAEVSSFLEDTYDGVEVAETVSEFLLSSDMQPQIKEIRKDIDELSARPIPQSETDPVFREWKNSSDIIAGNNTNVEKNEFGNNNPQLEYTYNKVAVYGSNISVANFEGVTTYANRAGVFIGDKIRSEAAFGGHGTFKAKGNVAIGRSINLSGQNIIALGDGEDGYGRGSTDISDEDAFYVWDKKMLDQATGKIPVERIPDIPEGLVSGIGYIKSADASQIAQGIVSEVSTLLETTANHEEDMRSLTDTISTVSTDLSNAISSEAERALSGEISALTSAKQYTDEKLSALTGYLPLSGGTLTGGDNFAIVGNEGQKTYTYLSVTKDSTMFGYFSSPFFLTDDYSDSTSFGAEAKSQKQSVAIGTKAQSRGENNIVIGYNSSATNLSSITIGANNQVKTTNSIVIGNNINTNEGKNLQIIIGNDNNKDPEARNSENEIIILGTRNGIAAAGSIAIGTGNLINNSNNAIAIGTNSKINGNAPGAIMLGTGYIPHKGDGAYTSSFWVNCYQMLDQNGDIPEERVSAIGYASNIALTNHVNNTSNPHNVTGQQVGVLTQGGKISSDLVVADSISNGAVTPEKLDRAYLPLSGGDLMGPVSSTSTFAASSVSATTLSGGTLYFQDGTLLSTTPVFDGSEYVRKDELSAVISSALSDFNQYVYETNWSCQTISNLIDWTRALHLALLSVASLTAPAPESQGNDPTPGGDDPTPGG